MIEFLESLLTGTGKDLDLKTLKVTDLISGRTMGIRADITPQIARIDAHALNRSGAVRLCYAGTVMHSKADNMLVSRTPLKVGAELFGDTSRDGDLEIVSLMVESLNALAIKDVHLELGDVSIFHQLVDLAKLDEPAKEELFALVQRKAFAELNLLVAKLNIDKEIAELLNELPSLCGDETVLQKSKELFAEHPKIIARLENLEWLVERLLRRFPDIQIYCDLSELRGYNYHTGLVFAAYVGRSSQALAKGGRYDHIGEVFGRRRGATGFDIVLNDLPEDVAAVSQEKKTVVARKGTPDTELSRWEKIKHLRDEGYIVVESGDLREEFNFELVYKTEEWQLRSISRE
jgi:ATP phosphoribosyltransferase regulatory subunit